MSFIDAIGLNYEDIWSHIDLPKQEIIWEDSDDNENRGDIQYDELGVGLIFAKQKKRERLTTVLFFLNNDQGTSPYLGELPLNIDKALSYESIDTLINKQADLVGGGKEGRFGYIPPWKKYFIGGEKYLHVQFSDDVLCQVSLGDSSIED